MSALHQITNFIFRKITHNKEQIEPVHHSLQSQNALKSVEKLHAEASNSDEPEVKRMTDTGQKEL